MPVTGARCHLEQASIGSLCFVSCRTPCFSSSTQHPVPVLLCCDSLGVSAQLCTTTWSSSTGPWAPQQTMGTECLLCHQLQLFPARPQSPGCAGPVLGAPQQPQQPAACCPSQGLCHCLPHLQLCVATQKSRAGGSGEGSQPMPVCLGRSLPSAWTSRALEVCQTISCKPATSGEYSKPLPWQQAQ